MLESFKEIIYGICEEENIKYAEYSNGWIIELVKVNTIRHIVGMRFPLNDYATATILNDKYATYSILKEYNIPIIDHKMFFNPNTRAGYVSDFKNEVEICNYLKNQSNGSIIIKANSGSCGTEVYKCVSIDEIYGNLNKLFASNDSVSICPFYDIKCEYRLVYLENECKLIFGKVAPKNGWKHNLAQGAEIIEVTDKELINDLKNIADKVVKVLSCKFVSIDIAQLKDDNLLVMEVNASVSIIKYSAFSDSNLKLAKEIYRQAILKSFDVENN